VALPAFAAARRAAALLLLLLAAGRAAIDRHLLVYFYLYFVHYCLYLFSASVHSGE